MRTVAVGVWESSETRVPRSGGAASAGDSIGARRASRAKGWYSTGTHRSLEPRRLVVRMAHQRTRERKKANG